MRFALAILFLAAAIPSLHAGAAEDWAYIVSLDAGPKKKPATRREAVLLAGNHLLLQRKTLEQFLAKHPKGPHVFDARLRLAAVLAAEGKMTGNRSQVVAAQRELAELENLPGISHDQRADAGFRRVSLFMQSQIGSTNRMREAIVRAVRGYTSKYPGDRRGPRLLVEAATICDAVPRVKRDLLEEALRLTREEPLKRRIADDLTRLDLLGRPLELKLSSIQAGPIDLPALRGNVVVVIFWAADSPHSLLWMRNFRRDWEAMPHDNLRVVTISLDKDRRTLDERLRDLPSSWPAHFDGKGWESPTARALGINALPTVWILDKKGVLRTLDAHDSYTSVIRQLLRE